MTHDTVGSTATGTLRAVVPPEPDEPEVLDDASLAILDAARDLLTTEGPASLTVRRIAAQAGGSTMNVYSRFGGKDGVLDALFREGFATLHQAMQRTRTTADPVADLRRCSAAYRRFALENRTSYLLMFSRWDSSFAPSAEGIAEAKATLRLLADRVQLALDAGALAPGDAGLLAADLWATNHGLVSLELVGMGPPDVDWARRHTETIDALLRGLAPSSADGT